MDKDFDSDTLSGSKRRISELHSEMEAIQRIVDDPPSDFLSLKPQPPSSAIVASITSDSASDGLLKKPKCSSSDESQTSIAVQENQEIDLGSVKDVVLNVGGQEGRLVKEEDMGLGKSELGFSGVQEFDEVHESLGSELAMSELGFSVNQEFDEVCKSSSSDLAKSELGFSGNQEFGEVHKSSSSDFAKYELGFSGTQEFDGGHESLGADLDKSELGFSGTQEFDGGHESLGADLAKSELVVSGTQEFDGVHKSPSSRSSCIFTAIEDQMDSVVEDCNKGLVTSSTTFDENESELFLRNKEKQCLVEPEVESLCDAKNHVLKPTDCESSRTIVENSSTGEPERNGNKKQIGQIVGEKLDGLKGVGGALSCSLKIEVIDDTAVIETFPASGFGVGCGKEKRFMGYAKNSERNGNKKHMKEDADGKKEKRPRRKGKGGKNAFGANEKEKILTQIAEVPVASEIKGAKAKRTYSKKEMESLRFVDVEAQRKKWIEVYCGLGPSVVSEYDGLVAHNPPKHIHLDFDPRKQFGRRPEATGILSEECSHNVDNEIESMNPQDPVCGLCVSDIDGECSEEENSDEDYSSIQRPAFFVTGKPKFDSGPPEDGLEYLRRVRWEAGQIPKVKVAKLEKKKVHKEQTVYMPKIPDIAKCPEHLMPMKQWEDAFLTDFSELRLAFSHFEASRAEIYDKLQSLPIVSDEENSQQLDESMILYNFDKLTSDGVESCQALDCSVPESFSSQLLLSNADENNTSLTVEDSSHKSSSDGRSDNTPTLSAILKMDSVARISMLRKRISSLEARATLSRNDCAWLYALCAAIDTPLNADTSAALRCLLRKSASLRAEKSELDDEVIMLNILATISGRYFGQSDN